VRKARYEELGHPCKLSMNLNLEKGVFECAKEESKNDDD
jgi:hypothetical protein